MDTLKSGQPPYNGHTVHPLPFIVHAFLPLKKGQPLNNGQNARPQCVHYLEVPLYTICDELFKQLGYIYRGKLNKGGCDKWAKK